MTALLHSLAGIPWAQVFAALLAFCGLVTVIAGLGLRRHRACNMCERCGRGIRTYRTTRERWPAGTGVEVEWLCVDCWADDHGETAKSLADTPDCDEEILT